MTTTDGSCLCGDVHFALTFPSKWVAHCHCSLCRRAHGAAFVTWVGMEDTRVAIDDPHSRLRWYASTPGAERGFCSRCGSTLFFRSATGPANCTSRSPTSTAPPTAHRRRMPTGTRMSTGPQWIRRTDSSGCPIPSRRDASMRMSAAHGIATHAC